MLTPDLDTSTWTDSCVEISVSDPDSFFTKPDPGFFPNPDPDPGNKKTNFSKAKTNFWEKFLFSTQKVGILFLFSTNQVGTYFIKQRTIIWYHFKK